MKTFRITCIAFFLLALTKPDRKITVYLAGDSTMCYYEPARAPVTGWGMPFAGFFDSTVRIDNRARGGRSTRTFIEEARWQGIVNDLREGDYVLIQFGHNDEAREARYRDRYTPVPDYIKNLERFIRETKSKGATPVLITPVTRRRFSREGKIEETHREYSAAVRQVAGAQAALLIDLDAKSRALLQQFGAEGSALLFMQLAPGEHPNYPEGQNDNTHFNEFGARKLAQLVLQGIRESGIELSNRIIRK